MKHNVNRIGLNFFLMLMDIVIAERGYDVRL